MPWLISAGGILSNKERVAILEWMQVVKQLHGPKVGKSKSIVPGRKHKATLSHVEIYNGIPGTSVIKGLQIRTAHSLLLRFFH